VSRDFATTATTMHHQGHKGRWSRCSWKAKASLIASNCNRNETSLCRGLTLRAFDLSQRVRAVRRMQRSLDSKRASTKHV